MSLPKMIPVSSSNIISVGYDEKEEEAYVKFANGTVYAYEEVSQEEFDALLNAESVGSHLARVLKPSHPAKKVA